MGDLEEARNYLNKVIQEVVKHAPSFSFQIKQIEKARSELKKLSDEEQFLKDRIRKEEKISDAFGKLSNKENGMNENINRYNEMVELFRAEVLKNAKYAINEGRKPPIFYLEGTGYSPLIRDVRIKTRIIKKKAEISRKIYHLHQLQQKVFCLSEDLDSNFADYQINRNIDYSEYKMENFSNYIKDKLMSAKLINFHSPTHESISKLSDFFSNSLYSQLENYEDKNPTIPLPEFSFHQLDSTNKREIPNYFSDFSKLITPALQEIIINVEELIKEVSQIFQIENSTIKSSAENFFKSNPSFIHTASVLCSNIIFKSQEKIIEAQKIAFLINQNISSPDAKILNESQHIQYLLSELVAVFDTIYDRLSRNQIIGQNISYDFDQTKFQDFSIEELSHVQIEKCNSIISEMKQIFDKSLSVNKSFFGILDDILTRSREIRSSRPTIDLDIEISPPKAIDDSDIRKEFLLLKQSILQKQSEQLNHLSDVLEQIPDEVKEIQIKEQEETTQPEMSTGLHFPSRNEDNSENLPFEFTPNVSQIKSNPYQDSNQNLLEKIVKKEKDPSEYKLIKPKENPDASQQNDKDILEKPRKYYDVIENIKNSLASSVHTDKIEDLNSQREALLDELRQKTKLFNISQFQKNEKMKKELTKRDLINSKKEKREEIQNGLNEAKSKYNQLKEALALVTEEMELYQNEKNELETEQVRIELLKSEYEKKYQLLKNIKEEEINFKVQNKLE